MSLLCVLSASPRTSAEAALLSRRMLSMRPCADALLVLCDLPDAFAEVMPEDEPLLRALQSAVMAADARQPGHFLLLVRKRVWDDAARLYLGENQPVSPIQTVASLLDHGQAHASFAAASFSPASLAGQFSDVLFCPACVSCAPDVSRRMLAASDESGLLAARVLPPLDDRTPLLTRLPDFAFSEGLAALRFHLARRRCAMISSGVLLASSKVFPLLEKASSVDSCPLWEEAAFVADDTPSLQRSLRQTACFFDALCRLPTPTGLQKFMLLAPMFRLFLLVLAAVTGWEALAVLALLEPYALLHPRLLPAALVRAAFLPMTAVCAFNTFLAHRLARSPLLRIRFPRGAQTPTACAVCGAALIPIAFFSLHAFAPLLFVSLLWLAAPPLFRALNLPEAERIPLNADERARVLQLARETFNAPVDHAAPGRSMLVACGGCMLDFLEPDEAARRMLALLPDLQSLPFDAHETACALAAAQFIRERMGDCDAALRELPTQIEQACMPEDIALWLSDILDGAQARNALFLPLCRVRVSCFITHPHSFLALPDKAKTPDDSWAFLMFCDVLCAHAFFSLFWRSPAAAPYRSGVTIGALPQTPPET